MAEAKVERLPFFVSDDEKKALRDTPQDNLSENLKDAVPEFTDVEKGEIVCSFGKKDGLLVYHVYNKTRKKIFDDAHEALAATRDSDMHQQISKNANDMLSANPWWPGFEDILKEVFTDHFKYSELKASYYQEVDSWSVIMPEPRSAIMPQSHLEAVVAKLALKVAG